MSDYRTYYLMGKDRASKRNVRFIVRASSIAFAIQLCDADYDVDFWRFYTDKTYTTHAKVK